MPSVPPPRVTSPPSAPPAPSEPPRTDRGAAPWPIWTVLAAIGMGLVVAVLAEAIVAGIGRAAGSSSNSPGVNIVSDIVFDVSFVAVAAYLAVHVGHARPRDFGYRWVAPSLAIGVFLAAGVFYYVISAVYQAIFHLHGTDKLPKGLGVETSTAALVGAAIFVCVAAPIAEEFFFRGFIFGALRRWRFIVAGHDLGTWAAAVVTGILFGLVHAGSAPAEYLIPLAFLGFVLCLVRWRTGSLYPCMALHSVNNSLALGINQLHWDAAAVVGLLAASLTVVGAITLPLAGRPPWRAGRSPARAS